MLLSGRRFRSLGRALGLVALAFVPVGGSSDDGDPCSGCCETYVESGLFARVPPGAELEIGVTDDPRPRAEAGAVFTLVGVTVQVWRSLQCGADEANEAIGRDVEGGALFVRTEDDDLAECVLAGLRYDPQLDREESRSEQE